RRGRSASIVDAQGSKCVVYPRLEVPIGVEIPGRSSDQAPAGWGSQGCQQHTGRRLRVGDVDLARDEDVLDQLVCVPTDDADYVVPELSSWPREPGAVQYAYGYGHRWNASPRLLRFP